MASVMAGKASGGLHSQVAAYHPVGALQHELELQAVGVAVFV